VKDAVNGVDRHPMGNSKRYDILATISLNGGMTEAMIPAVLTVFFELR
jgi:hypothetical protein